MSVLEGWWAFWSITFYISILIFEGGSNMKNTMIKKIAKAVIESKCRICGKEFKYTVNVPKSSSVDYFERNKRELCKDCYSIDKAEKAYKQLVPALITRFNHDRDIALLVIKTTESMYCLADRLKELGYEWHSKLNSYVKYVDNLEIFKREVELLKSNNINITIDNRLLGFDNSMSEPYVLLKYQQSLYDELENPI